MDLLQVLGSSMIATGIAVGALAGRSTYSQVIDFVEDDLTDKKDPFQVDLTVEQAIKISGWLYEMDHPTVDTKQLLNMQNQSGFYPIDIVTDCKSSYDAVTGEMARLVKIGFVLWLSLIHI